MRLVCLHFLRHGGWRPLWLCDVGLLAESLPPDFDWDICLRGSIRHVDQIACTLGLAHTLLGAALPDLPLWRRTQSLPRWLSSALLAQWSTRYERYSGAPFMHYVSKHRGVIAALRRRWPNPIEATVSIGGPFDSWPRFPFQVGDCLRRAWRLSRRPAQGADPSGLNVSPVV